MDHDPSHCLGNQVSMPALFTASHGAAINIILIIIIIIELSISHKAIEIFGTGCTYFSNFPVYINHCVV